MGSLPFMATHPVGNVRPRLNFRPLPHQHAEMTIVVLRGALGWSQADEGLGGAANHLDGLESTLCRAKQIPAVTWVCMRHRLV
jgi:hypothetical protein